MAENSQVDDPEDDGWIVYQTVEKDDGELESEAWCTLHGGRAPAVVEIAKKVCACADCLKDALGALSS